MNAGVALKRNNVSWTLFNLGLLQDSGKHGMSAFLPVKELAALALSGRPNLRDEFHVCNCAAYWRASFVEVISKG